MLRIQKFLSSAGVLSRRAAEKAVAAGEVFVDGKKAEIGASVDPINSVVTYRGRVIKAPNLTAPEGKAHYEYIMLHKPKGYVTTLSDEKGRPCVAELVTGVGTRVYPVGRLDMYSEGLLLLTSDGELANRLMHPRHALPKVYYVTVSDEPTEAQLALLRTSLVIDGYKIRPVEVEPLEVMQLPKRTVLSFTLREGRNRQIRKMCDIAGLEVRVLKRVSIGDIKLGTLEPGRWKRLTISQVRMLKG